MTPTTVATEAVGPLELLAARDARAQRQQALAARHPGATVVSVTLVVPGPVKTSPVLERVRDEAVAATVRSCRQRGWPVASSATTDGATGPEAVLAVSADPAEVKRELVRLEDAHPVGRLWDLDVLDTGRPLSRTALGAPPRRCLVCAGPAHACARSQAHDPLRLARALEVLCDRLPA